jgi:flagellar FliL protein
VGKGDFMVAENEKKFPVTLVVGLIIVGLLLAGGISYFIATKVATSSNTISHTAQREPGTFIKLGDAKDGLILNIGGVNSGRYLKIGVILELKPNKNDPPKDAKALSPEEVKILDSVVYILRMQKIEDFDPAKQDHLKELIKGEVNRVLGEDRVYEVYITNFVLQ